MCNIYAQNCEPIAGNATMPTPAPPNGFPTRRFLGAALASLACIAAFGARALTEDSILQQAVNYVFTGRLEPRDGAEIVDRTSCIVVLPDLKSRRYIRYSLS